MAVKDSHPVQLYKEKSLGHGAYGFVCRARYGDLPCAAKSPHRTMFTSSDPGAVSFLEKFKKECEFLNSLNHPNIVQYLGVMVDPATRLPVLLMELMEESLTHFLERSAPPISYHLQIDISYSIALGLSYLHRNDIMHRDLSSNNVLLNGGCCVKLTDLGMARLVEKTPRATPLTDVPGTLVYMPPEALLAQPKYTNSIDCFSLGVLAIQIITCKFPNPGVAKKEVPELRSPTGKIEMPISEVERRRNDMSGIEATHPLLLVALDCIKDVESRRPSSHDLCQRLEGLRGSEKYSKSKLLFENMEERMMGSLAEQKAEIERLKGQVGEMNVTVASQSAELERLRKELKEKEATLKLQRKEEAQKLVCVLY